MKNIHRYLIIAALLILNSQLSILNSQAQTFPQCILAGDYPDPSIMRDGDDYYMTHSPFYYKPGFLIWHSQDLANWQLVCYAATDWQGSAMAPDLLKHNDRYYIYFPAAGTNWVIWADSIRGVWSKPIDLKVSGIDPGHIVGEDGKRYLYLSGGEYIELTDDGLATVGSKHKVYDGWVFPRQWETECMCLESPKLNYKNGYFYMTSAEGGTAGPATSHMIVAARSKSVKGPWENSPYNPIVHTYSATDNWWSKGHGTLIDDPNGNWYVVYHAYAKDYHTLGRQTLIEPVEWAQDGWYIAAPRLSPTSILHSAKNKVPTAFSISFPPLGGIKGGLGFTFWKEYSPESIILKDSVLTLIGKGATPADARLLLTTATDKAYETQVAFTLDKGNSAGLALFYNEKAFAGIVADNKNFTLYLNANDKMLIPNPFGKSGVLKIINRGNRCTFLASGDNRTWTTLADNVDVSSLHHNNYNGFYALRPALLSAGKGAAHFKDFSCKNAIPTEKDMAAYLMVYHLDETHSLHFALSRDGYTFTALNDNKPIVAGDTIANQHGIRDPHICRGPDGAFYMTMTDLHAKGKEAGLRDTEFERDRKDYGWGNNRGIVLMKSWNLLNWTHTAIRIDTLSAEFSEMGCAWAPEVVYDEERGKLMIHFAIRFRNEALRMYYVYANDDFNRIETLPRLLWEYPIENTGVLDANITKFDGKYFMFYAVNDDTAGGVKLAVSDHINRDYAFNHRFYDFETASCEAPSIWKRIGEDKWVLMVDVSWLKPQNFGFAETSDFVNFTYLGHFNDGIMKTTNFIPKHGAVIPLTAAEADRLEDYLRPPSRFRDNN